jgi:hypothetical protein
LTTSLPQLSLQAATAPQPAAAATHPSQTPHSSDNPHEAAVNGITTTVNANPKQATGVLQLGQFTSPQALLSVWQQQLLPGCHTAWGELRAETQTLIRQLNAQTQQQQLQQQAWSAADFLLELDVLLGELQEVRSKTCA